MKTGTGKYMIYEFYNEKTEERYKEFFLPNRSFFDRINTTVDYKQRGFVLASINFVSKEIYLNERLNDTVEDYLENDKQEQEALKKFNKGEMSLDTYKETLYLIQSYRWTILKRMGLQIRRLVREDFEVNNEIAIQLYDLYLKASL